MYVTLIFTQYCIVYETMYTFSSDLTGSFLVSFADYMPPPRCPTAHEHVTASFYF